MIDFTRLFGSEHVVFGVFFKSFAVIGSVMYFVYAVILIRQTAVMLKALEEAYSPFIRVIAYFQLLLAIIMIILALTIL